MEDRDYLVDPLAQGVDLAGLGPLLADPVRTKVFHDGEYDVLIMKRDYGFDFGYIYGVQGQPLTNTMRFSLNIAF